MKRNIVVVSLIVIFVAVALYRNLVQADDVVLPKEEAPKIGFLAPSFTLTSMDGTETAVGGQRGKALLINFWASWCGPCEIEAPDLVANYESYQDRLDIYAVNMTGIDKEDLAREFAERHGFKFPVLFDRGNKVTDLYMVTGYPTTFFVDKNGVIRDMVVGILPPAELERKILKLL